MTPGILLAPGAVGVAALLLFLALAPLSPPKRHTTRVDQIQVWCIRAMVVAAVFVAFVFGVQEASGANSLVMNLLVGAFGTGAGALLLFGRWALTRVGEIEKRQEHAQKGRLAGLLGPALFNLLAAGVLAYVAAVEAS